MQAQRFSVHRRRMWIAIAAGVIVYGALYALGGTTLRSNVASAASAYQYQYLTVIKHVITNDGATASADEWSIHVKSGASEVPGSPQPGSEAGTTYPLDPGTYIVSETGGPAGFVFAGFARDCDSAGTVTFSAADAYKTCTLTNNDIGQRRTPGYWKTHLAAVAPMLPVSLGDYPVATSARAGAIFGEMNCSGFKPANASGCLAGHLLAAKLNIANGNSTCIQPTVDKADMLLVSIGYAGPSGVYTLTSSQRALAVALADALDKYNNGKSCFNP